MQKDSLLQLQTSMVQLWDSVPQSTISSLPSYNPQNICLLTYYVEV